MLCILDCEVTYQGRWNSDDSDPTAFNPLNKLVSVGWRTTTGEKGYVILNHKHRVLSYVERLAAFDQIQDVLNRSKMVIGHNLKFDMTWLYECGFEYDGLLYDTMIYAYMKAQGLKTTLALASLLEGLGLPKKLDILQKYCGEQGLNVDEVPIPELIEYGTADIDGTYALFNHQRQELKADELLKSTTPALKMMNEFLAVLIDVERSGIKIDSSALDEVEELFKTKHKELEGTLKKILTDVMGHTPINLGSPEQMSWVLHSIKVNDKNAWKDIFNLGSEERNGVKKAKYVKRYPEKEFRQIVRQNTTTVYKTSASQCPSCMGKGYIQLHCKDGRPRKRLNVCHECEKSGIRYETLPEVAGFRINPISSEYASDGGFSSSKDVLDDLLATGVKGQAKLFLESLKEYNAISTYLSSFVEGIRRNTRGDGLLHTSFNQTVASTGRLSSTRPNLQNQPRESTFPIRKVFVSRFVGGELLNADFSQLEFRTAAALSKCQNAIQDILDKIDVHQQTSDWLGEAGEPTSRQDSKKYTFRPLFGGNSGTEAQKTYISYFFKKYCGIAEWHDFLLEFALKHKYIQSPSGRVYAFPWVERRRNGGVSHHTQIKNYLVQGFATGDILPVVMIEIHRLMKEAKVKSLLVLTVHDSIVTDVYPGEKDIMIDIYRQGFEALPRLLKERFNFETVVPFGYDLDCGVNLLDKKKIKI